MRDHTAQHLRPRAVSPFNHHHTDVIGVIMDQEMGGTHIVSSF